LGTKQKSGKQNYKNPGTKVRKSRNKKSRNKSLENLGTKN
jgi:hypothetical protein